MANNENTTLTPATGYDVSRLTFSKPVKSVVPESDPPMTIRRIYIGTKNPNGTTGELIIPTEELFSYGVQVSTDKASGRITGYSLPLAMWSKDGATDAEKAFTDTFNKIVERVKDHLLEVRNDIGKFDLERGDLKKLNPLYWSRDKNTGKIIDDKGPTL